MAVAQDRFFDSGGVRIRYVDHGAGAPVILIHGFTANIERGWVQTGILPDLARDYRVIAFDLRGHGKSDKPHDPRAYEEVGLDAIHLMNHLGIERAHAVGYSLGGIILAKLLTMHPARFTSAVLGGAAYRRSQSKDADRETEAAAREIEAGIYRALVVSTAPTDEPPPDEDAIRRRSREISRESDLLAHAALMRARRALLVTDAEIAAVRVPTLAVVGAADPAAAARQGDAEALARARGGGRAWSGAPDGPCARPAPPAGVRGWRSAGTLHGRTGRPHIG